MDTKNNPIIIAEIGNCHFGDIDMFKEMIFLAKQSGADLVKGQAISPRDAVINGSMPLSFYEACDLGMKTYIDLITWAKEAVDIDLFFSIFSENYYKIASFQQYRKISGAQSQNNNHIKGEENWFVSIRKGGKLPKIGTATPLYVTGYLEENPDLEFIKKLSIVYKKQAGYSDHTIDPQNCIKAARMGASVIEKHFCLEKSQTFDGVIFRDTVHGFTPQEFKQLTGEIRNGK